MMKAKAANPADLLREARNIETEEAAIKRRKLALARKLIEAGQALGGDDLEDAPKPKRKTARRARAARSEPVTRTPRGERRDGPHMLKRSGWTHTILKVVTEANRPITHAEVKAEVAKTDLGQRLRVSESGFYGAILKLSRKNLIKRENGYLLAPHVYERLNRAGPTVPPLPPVNRHSPTRDAIVEFLRANPGGGKTAEILGYVMSRPGFDTRNRYSRTVVYNLVSRLVKQGVLTKEGEIVRLPQLGNGTHVTSEAESVIENERTAEDFFSAARH